MAGALHSEQLLGLGGPGIGVFAVLPRVSPGLRRRTAARGEIASISSNGYEIMNFTLLIRVGIVAIESQMPADVTPPLSSG